VLDLLASPVGQLLALIHRGLSTFLIPSSGPAWALSIVLLTVTVRLLLFPLFVKQIKSQRRMQELAPKIKELQKQHKGDRETLNVEMMKLYKENNANPISGCLPLLLQLPVFFALFTVIRNFKTDADAMYGLTAQQLREGAQAQVLGAPISAAFNSPASLISELGANHTTVRLVAFLMVIGMGASTFWTQRQLMARAGTTDPQQVMVQKLLLYVLPLSFAVSGVFFPIGVLLYWLTTNVWSMGQQAWVIKRMPPVNLTPGKPGPAGESRAKDKGTAAGGRSDKRGKAPKAAVEPDTGAGPAPGNATPLPNASTGPSSVVERSPGATPKAAVSAPSKRRPAGSRKNKNRRGGRR
jgi:YidC/Oxa1 family membrane protein insertase